MKIIVNKNEKNQYYASPENNSNVWMIGKTPEEAIGKLIYYRQDILKIEVEVNES